MIENIAECIKNLCNIDTQLEKAQSKDIVSFHAFYQTWGSTALGFGGLGCSAMTAALTTVIQTKDHKYYVFFDDRLAYCVEKPNEEFFNDFHKQNMKSCSKAAQAY